MKTQTIKALQGLCDELMEFGGNSGSCLGKKLCVAADRLKRVLDEEPNPELIFKRGTICNPNYDPLLDD